MKIRPVLWAIGVSAWAVVASSANALTIIEIDSPQGGGFVVPTNPYRQGGSVTPLSPGNSGGGFINPNNNPNQGGGFINPNNNPNQGGRFIPPNNGSDPGGSFVDPNQQGGGSLSPNTQLIQPTQPNAFYNDRAVDIAVKHVKWRYPDTRNRTLSVVNVSQQFNLTRVILEDGTTTYEMDVNPSTREVVSSHRGR